MSSRPFPPRRRGELLLEFLQVTRRRDGGPRNVLVGPANDLPEHREKLGALPGQAVLMANRIALVGLFRQQTRFFQSLQPVSQDVGDGAGGAGGADTRGRFTLLHGHTVPPGVMTCKCKVTDLE